MQVKNSSIIGFIVFLLVALIWQLIYDIYGQSAGFRSWGIGLLVVSIIFTFKDNIPLFLGDKQTGELKGWRKSYVLIPSYLIGLLVAFYPNEVACTIALKNYACP